MEAKLTELVKRLRDVTGDNLKAAVLYGSAVSGEFIAKHSDLNILCVVGAAGAAQLEQLHPVAQWWTREGNRIPLIFTLDELVRSADVFAIELLDIKRHHRMLFGADFLEQFDVPMHMHRLQVERELRTGWLRLRQAILVAPRKRKIQLGIMLSSISAFCVLLRHALLAMGQPEVHTKREAVNAMASLCGANASAFHAILDVREGKRKEGAIEAEETLQLYLEFVEVVTNEVDRRLETH